MHLNISFEKFKPELAPEDTDRLYQEHPDPGLFQTHTHTHRVGVYVPVAPASVSLRERDFSAA